jgi:SAM-dependent methyltransferase
MDSQPPTRDPTERFSTRVHNYAAYRPHYPKRVIEILGEQAGLTSTSVVADIGSGTGLLTERFLENGNEVCAVEPNREMREMAEHLLRRYSRMHSVAGRAEATTLPDGSVDLVVAGQAFHWFDCARARAEFVRILRKPARVALVWNERLTTTTAFLQAYEQLLEQYSIDYAQVDHRRIDDAVLADFFAPTGVHAATVENRQSFDYAGLRGRLLSSSYAPQDGHPKYEPMLAALDTIFRAHVTDGRVEFQYLTKLYFGELQP